MIIGLRAGHSDNCTGAIGIVNEHEQMKLFYAAIKPILEKYGHTVIDCNSNASTENGELLEGATKANNANVDLFISLHMNCFNGSANGTEVLISSANSDAYPYATRLISNYASLGFVNRGIKFESLYEMNHIKAPNIISEICFCDSQTDINIYNKYSWEQLAYVFCNAIDPNIPLFSIEEKCFVVTDYLPKDSSGYLDINYILSYFNGIKCFFKSDEKGIWICTDWITQEQADKLKTVLGSWYYDTKTK